MRRAEAVARRLEPGALAGVRAPLTARADALAAAREALAATPAPEGLGGLQEELGRAAAHAEEALRRLAAVEGPEAVANALAGLRAHARAEEALYPLRRVFPPLARHFVEAAFPGDPSALDREPPPGVSVGLHRAGGGRDARGGFTLYVPEHYDGARAWPLVVALHGAWGHGADFVWTWLREARGRGFLLLAPTSRATSWSLDAPAREMRALRAMLDLVSERWRVDPARILLTGLSDGGTFALRVGLEADAPWTAIAPGACVLHPATRLAGARGRRILWVHGARDWMFPVSLARVACDVLRDAGAEVDLRVVEDLGHGWAREENDRILCWWDPTLALPGAASDAGGTGTRDAGGAAPRDGLGTPAPGAPGGAGPRRGGPA